MKKYFIINRADLSAQYDEAVENEEKIRLAVCKVREHFKIESTGYYNTASRLALVLPEVEQERFKDVLMKSGTSFKKSSPQNKMFLKILKDMDYSGVSKPKLFFEIGGIGRGRWGQFKVNGIYYGYLERDSAFTLPDGFTEIKASEYYKVIEDYEKEMEG